MYKEQRFKGMRVNDSGQKLHFRLFNDGSPYSIPDGATVTFEAYLDGASTLKINDANHVTVLEQTENNIGRAYYTVQNGDFTTGDAGDYWCRMKVNTITSYEAKLPVSEEYSNGE